MNYAKIRNSNELPKQLSTIVGWNTDDERDARQYAVEHPDRQIY